jgi:hypothetical protein
MIGDLKRKNFPMDILHIFCPALQVGGCENFFTEKNQLFTARQVSKNGLSSKKLIWDNKNACHGFKINKVKIKYH